MNGKHRTQKEIWSGYMRTLGQVLAIGPILWIWRVVTKLFKPKEPVVIKRQAPPPPRHFDQFTANMAEIRNILNQMQNE